ncbi:MAG: TraB/GumN family protein [Gammaproteobacteria bacterium]|nr:TraB/GumN family protein [Gammaproteobacteria bacterium]
MCRYFLVAVLFIVIPVSNIQAGTEQRGIVWQIKAEGSLPSYIMGTVHSDDARVLQLPKPVQAVFDRANSFTAELKLDFSTMQKAAEMMFSESVRPLKLLIGQQRYQNIVPLMAKHGISATQLQNMKPWAVAVSLSMPESKGGPVLDAFLYQLAQSQGKKLYGLETVKEQISVFESLSTQQQISLLDEAMLQHKKMDTVYAELIELYLQRDLTALEQASKKYMQMGDQSLTDKLNQKILIERNYRMVRRMQVRLKDGNSFIAVGALHLPGDEGILRLLQKQGYRVTAIY